VSRYKIVMLGTAVVAAAATVLTVIVTVLPTETESDNATGSNSCIVNGSQGSCIVDSSSTELLQDPNAEVDQTRRRLEEAGRNSTPTGTGPWQFVVLGTKDLGLKIRSNAGRSGSQIGSLAEKSTAWVECQIRNDFDPVGAAGPGPVWYKIRWPNRTSTTQFFNSEPRSPYRGWGYKHYLIPFGHNGLIPQCADG
jgi:hypothetical protein